MGLVGCYDLHLYCDHPEHTAGLMGNSQVEYDLYKQTTPAEYTGRTEMECIRTARRDGWKIDKRKQGENGIGYALCPYHRSRRGHK